jgi:hypothetical protein
LTCCSARQRGRCLLRVRLGLVTSSNEPSSCEFMLRLIGAAHLQPSPLPLTFFFPTVLPCAHAGGPFFFFRPPLLRKTPTHHEGKNRRKKSGRLKPVLSVSSFFRDLTKREHRETQT